MMNSPKHDALLSVTRCKQCGRILPAVAPASRREIFLDVACGVVLLAILAPAVYLGAKWTADHFYDFSTNPPWHEPLDDWSVQ